MPEQAMFWLPRIAPASDVSPEQVAMACRSLSKLPDHVAEILSEHGIGVAVRANFPWGSEAPPYGHSRWSSCGGYWNNDTRYALGQRQLVR